MGRMPVDRLNRSLLYHESGDAKLSSSSGRQGRERRSAPCFRQVGSLHLPAMNLTQLTSANLQRIARLIEEREALQARVEGINRQLAAYEPTAAPNVPEAAALGTRTPAVRRKPEISAAGRARIAAAQRARWAKVKRAAGAGAAVKPAKVGRQKRGGLKDSVVALVKATGQPGITVAEVAAKLGAKPRRIFDWFRSTGKGFKEIKKVGRARYGWVG